jgi:hypothetical protein
MARRVNQPPKYVYMALVKRTYPDGRTYDEIQGPYSTIGAAKARLPWLKSHWALREGATETYHILGTTTNWEEIDV